MKLLSIFGTLPEAINMAPAMKGIEQHTQNEAIGKQKSNGANGPNALNALGIKKLFIYLWTSPIT